MSLLKYYLINSEELTNTYEQLKNAGEDARRIELARKNMAKYFPDIQEKDFLQLLNENQIFGQMLTLVRNAFIDWYNWDPGEILINQNNQNSINSYAVTTEQFPMFIHIDQLLESVTLNFMLVMLKWSKAIECNEPEQNYFTRLLYILNEVALMGQLPDESGKAAIFGRAASDWQIQDLAANCHWAMLIFTAGHEMAHIYQMSTNPEYWSTHLKEAEQSADSIGYDILLRLIMKKPESEVKVEEYAYLAPMMHMDLFNLVFYTDSILYGKSYESGIHGTPDERKENLFNIVDQEQYQFDTEFGNSIYQSFLDSYDRYCEMLPQYMAEGKLDGIIHRNQRNERESL